MRKSTRILAVIVGLAIVGSIVGMSGVAFADNPPNAPPTTTVTSRCDVFLGKLAAKLNLKVDQVKAAVIGARTDTINQLAAEGKITPAQKDQMLSRIQQGACGLGGSGAGCGAGFGPRGTLPTAVHRAPRFPRQSKQMIVWERGKDSSHTIEFPSGLQALN